MIKPTCVYPKFLLLEQMAELRLYKLDSTSIFLDCQLT